MHGWFCGLTLTLTLTHHGICGSLVVVSREAGAPLTSPTRPVQGPHPCPRPTHHACPITLQRSSVSRPHYKEAVSHEKRSLVWRVDRAAPALRMHTHAHHHHRHDNTANNSQDRQLCCRCGATMGIVLALAAAALLRANACCFQAGIVFAPGGGGGGGTFAPSCLNSFRSQSITNVTHTCARAHARTHTHTIWRLAARHIADRSTCRLVARWSAGGQQDAERICQRCQSRQREKRHSQMQYMQANGHVRVHTSVARRCKRSLSQELLRLCEL